MDPVDCYCWNSSGSFFYGSTLSIECVGVHALTLRHPKHPQISLDLTLCPQKNHGHFETETVLESAMAMDEVDCYCWNSSGSFFYGSMLSIECVAVHALIFLLCPILGGVLSSLGCDGELLIQFSIYLEVRLFWNFVVTLYNPFSLPSHYNHTVLLP